MAPVRQYAVLGPLISASENRAFLGCEVVEGAPRSDLPVVIVWLRDDVAQDPKVIARLSRETAFVTQLIHPNILRVHGLECFEEGWARVVAFVDGEPLSHVLTRAREVGRPVDPRIAARIALDVCAAVHHAHEEGLSRYAGRPIVHGGLRPDTLLITFEGRTMVTGYGAAVLAPQSVPELGDRLAYLAPEQIIGGKATASSATDVYAIGAILYEMVSGLAPFAGAPDLERAVLTVDPPRTGAGAGGGIGERLGEVAATAMAKRGSDRFGGVLQLRNAILGVLGDQEPASEAELAALVNELVPATGPERTGRAALLESAGDPDSVTILSPPSLPADDVVPGEATEVVVPEPPPREDTELELQPRPNMAPASVVTALNEDVTEIAHPSSLPDEFTGDETRRVDAAPLPETAAGASSLESAGSPDAHAPPVVPAPHGIDLDPLPRAETAPLWPPPGAAALGVAGGVHPEPGGQPARAPNPERSNPERSNPERSNPERSNPERSNPERSVEPAGYAFEDAAARAADGGAPHREPSTLDPDPELAPAGSAGEIAAPRSRPPTVPEISLPSFPTLTGPVSRPGGPLSSNVTSGLFPPAEGAASALALEAQARAETNPAVPPPGAPARSTSEVWFASGGGPGSGGPGTSSGSGSISGSASGAGAPIPDALAAPPPPPPPSQVGREPLRAPPPPTNGLAAVPKAPMREVSAITAFDRKAGDSSRFVLMVVLAGVAALLGGMFMLSQPPPEVREQAQEETRHALPKDLVREALTKPVEPKPPVEEAPPQAGAGPEATAGAAGVKTEPPAKETGQGELRLATEPPVDVYDGVESLGRTPLTARLSAGAHQLRFTDKKTGLNVYRSYRIHANAEQHDSISFGTSQLIVDAPQGATVVLNSRVVGTAPLAPVTIYEGKYHLKVTLDGKSWADSFEAPPGKTINYKVTLHN